MIQVWVLFILTHGGMRPIMELPDQVTCERYVAQYERTHKVAECRHLQRRDGHFRPKFYGKTQ